MSSEKTRESKGVQEFALSEEDRRSVTLWAVTCAARALPLFEAKAPSDTRPREAVEAARAFALGDRRTVRLRTAAWGAYAAAREVGDPAAAAAARAAGGAAGAPYLHPLATPHQLKHVLGPAMYLARARECAEGDDPGVGDDEVRWALERVPPEVRVVVARMPAGRPGRTRLGALHRQLEAGLRACGGGYR
ncbi:hypothetical protein DMA15_07130 [Streptomyces sp. WAC 01529]|uniref:putative immunity protein n=1 Tax=Streptomyces sp. WAC 01529 TaxID=2203205 RepID=UPI000F6ED312|nr:hypothetical protein [Streptomyces sp. WAC 01529]AZM52403.1 hypothetical protein DMA15_07130 [Streptomyces sp. WAC 01529]